MLIQSFIDEYQRYRILGEKAIAQAPDDALNRVPVGNGNSIAMIVRHVGGNLASRFTNFLTEDGEKPNRDRDREFDERPYTRAEMDEIWKRGWSVVAANVGPLTDADLSRSVTIRQQPMTVHAALCRSLAHIAYHVGQIVLLAREHADQEWQSLSIPRGQSQQYNASPTREKKPG